MSFTTALRKKFTFDRESPWHFYRKVLLWSFVVASCLTVPFVIVEWVKTGSAVFLYYGDYNAQQICFYRHAVDMAREGSFGWDWVTDLGSNFVGSYSYYMIGSPFYWLFCLFPASWAPYLMAPMYIVKYIVAAVLAYAYLQRFVRNKDYAVIGAMLYAFSGFQIYNTFFNQFHDVVAFFPLLLIGMEEYVQNDRKGLFAVAVCLNAMINYFMFAGQAVFCILYFFFRSSSRTFDISLRKLGGLFFEAVLGFMMSMFIFLPGAAALMGNSRIERSYTGIIAEMFKGLLGGDFEAAKTNFIKLFVYRNGDKTYWQRYGQLFESYIFPPDIPSRVNFFYGHETRWASISMYLPLVSVSGVMALFSVKKRGWLKAFAVVLALMPFFPVTNSLFYLFNSSFYARWLYMLIMIFSLATVVALDDERTRWSIPFAVNTVLCTLVAAGLGLVWYLDPTNKTEYKLGYPPYTLRFWIYVALAFAGIAFTAMIFRRYRGTKLFSRALLIGVSCMTVLYGCIHITNGKMYSHDSSFMVDQCINGEVNLPDPHSGFYRLDFYRSSKISTMDNLGIYWNYPNIVCFHTVVPPSIMEFYPKIGVTRDVGSRPLSSYYGIRGFTSAKYSFIRTGDDKLTEKTVNGKTVYEGKHDTLGFTYVDTQNNYNIYENEYFLPMGFAYTEFMTESDFERAYITNQRHSMLCKYIVVPDEKADYYSQFMTRVYPNASKARAGEETYKASVLERREMCCSEFDYSSYGFNAKITLDKPNVVLFSVPYEADGWTATVNGTEREVLRVTYGFVAVECGAGENDIEFSYSTPGLAVPTTVTVAGKEIRLPGGLWISLCALAVYIAYMVFFKVIRKQKAKCRFFSFDYYDDMDAYPPAENARADAPGEPPAEDMPAQEDSGTEPGIPAQAAPGENTEAEVEIPETGGEDTDGKAED